MSWDLRRISRVRGGRSAWLLVVGVVLGAAIGGGGCSNGSDTQTRSLNSVDTSGPSPPNRVRTGTTRPAGGSSGATTPGNTGTLASDLQDDPNVTTTTAAGTKPAPVDDVVFSDLVDQFLGIMTGAENDPCALRSAYDYFVRLPDPNDPEQVQRFFEGAIVLFTSIADAFPPEQSSAAQAVRDRIDEWENETSLADYDPLAFLEFVPSDESLTAMQAFVGNTSAC